MLEGGVDLTRALPEPDLAKAAGPDARAQELLRLWMVDGQATTTLWRAFEDVGHWGLALAMVAEHVSRLYAADGSMTQEEALRQIAKNFSAAFARSVEAGQRPSA